MFKKLMKKALAIAAILGVCISSASPVFATDLVGKTYPSELTGMPISTTIQQQRPIAVMVDNEQKAYNHYGVNEADIVYEMVNSMANGRITRLMCIYKNYDLVPRIGSIRSTRPTNCTIAPEYNAILVHDGGPFYINNYLAKPYLDNLSGGFTRIDNGKAREFTEYVTIGAIKSRIAKAKYSVNYNAWALDRVMRHFLFNVADTNLSSTYTGVAPASSIDLSGSFMHTKSKLAYDSNTKTYQYYAYGAKHVDAEDGLPTTFKNVILQNVLCSQLDQNGYMVYGTTGTGTGYYITNGECIPITWAKRGETFRTVFYDQNGQELKLNAGKTYIGLVPLDTASTTLIK